MKTAMWIIGAIAAFMATTVDADGVCYDPDRGQSGGRNVAADLAQIKAKGFSHVRTYVSDSIGDLVGNSGLRFMLGIPYEIGEGNLEPHVQAALRAVQTGKVDYIMVGNENLAGQSYAPDGFIKYIYSIKNRFPGIRVGTVQRTTEIINLQNLGALAAAVDVLGVNVHPFFTDLGYTKKSPIGESQAQWDACKARANSVGKPLILTETGWPTSGGFAGNFGSTDSANAYWSSYKSSGIYGQLADSDKYYFQFFDTPNKGPEYERTYGLVGVNGDSKSINAGGVPAPAPTTPAPTTPAPTTAAPTTAPVSNSTSGSAENEEGVAGSGSASLGDAGEVGGESNTETDLGIATNEDAEITPAPESEGTETGDNTKDDATEANTQAEASSSSAGLVIVVMLGVAAVAGAFGFIYKARQKAAEVERSESKSFDMTVTPGGACVL